MSATDNLSSEAFFKTPAGAQAIQVFKETGSISKAQRHLEEKGFSFEGREGRAAYHWLANRLRRVAPPKDHKKRNRSGFLETPIGAAAAAHYRKCKSLKETRDYLASMGFDFDGIEGLKPRYLWTANKMRPITHELRSI